jgi:hypothetical protein
MEDKERLYTAEQVEAAATALRAAMGLPGQFFTTRDVVAMLSEEISSLLEAGRSAEEIAHILASEIGLDISPFEIHRAAISTAKAGAPR